MTVDWLSGRRTLASAWFVSIVALSGSLYFSEVAGFIPCTLCWVQRIFMYPLVLILGIATFRRDKGVAIYTFPLSFFGGLVSAHHYLLQKTDSSGTSGFCSSGVPCSGEYINWLGFITIPFLALVAFVLIGNLVLWSFLTRASDKQSDLV